MLILIRFAACLLLEVVCLFDWAFCVVWESLLLVGLGLLPLCYWNVHCLFDKVCSLCVMGKSVAHLISFAACVLYFFYSDYDRTFCKVTVETLIRRRVLRHLVWVCTICLRPTKRTLGLYGLIFYRRHLQY